MIAERLATVASGLFTGASIYINLVEHPARMEAGTQLALTEFAPSYKRATVVQVAFAIVGFLSSVRAWRSRLDARWLVGGGLLVAVIPFTLVAILPTNKRLLDPATARDMDLAKRLEKDGTISQDEGRQATDAIQKLTDEHIKMIDSMLATKEREITQV